MYVKCLLSLKQGSLKGLINLRFFRTIDSKLLHLEVDLCTKMFAWKALNAVLTNSAIIAPLPDLVIDLL